MAKAAVSTAKKEIAAAFVLTASFSCFGVKIPDQERDIYTTLTPGEVAELIVVTQEFFGDRALNKPQNAADIERGISDMALLPKARKMIFKNIIVENYGDDGPSASKATRDEKRLVADRVCAEIAPILLELNAIGATCERDDQNKIYERLVRLAHSKKKDVKFLSHLEWFVMWAQDRLYNYCGGVRPRDPTPKLGSDEEPFGVVVLKGASYRKISEVLDKHARRPNGVFATLVKPAIFKAG